MNTDTTKDEVIIKLVGKLTLEFPYLDQLKVRNIFEEILYKYEIKSGETSLAISDIDQKIEIYIACKTLEKLSPLTLKGYARELLKFSNYIHKPIANINSMDMRVYLAIRCKKLNPSSTNTQMNTFKSFFGWLNANGYIPTNPMLVIKLSKEPNLIRHPLTDEEVENLRQACKTDRQKALTEFLVSTGCRLSEAVKIDIDKIDWYGRSFFIIGKGSKERQVYFTVKAKILMEKYIKNRKGDSNALFTAEKYPHQRIGGRALEKEVDKIAELAGFIKSEKSIFPHLFRHTFATYSLLHGVSMPALQDMMGHSSADTTGIYAKISPQVVKYEYDRM